MNGHEIREHEHASIRWWVQRAAREGCFERGRVLDYGCGLQPYRDIVEEAGAQYLPFDRAANPANLSGDDIGDLEPEYDAILCTQVIQYVADPGDLLDEFWRQLKQGGYLVLTGPTNWPEVEADDLQRLTINGIRAALEDASFDVLAVESRVVVPIPGWQLSVGYGAIGWAK